MKKLLLFVALFIVNIYTTKAIDDTDISSFYYGTTIETISKYIDDKNTTLWLLLEYNNFLKEKKITEKNEKKLEIIDKLIEINEKNIFEKKLSYDTDEKNIEEFINYFSSKWIPTYQKYIDLIKNNKFLNIKDELWENMFLEILKNWTYDDIDFALNKWLNPSNKNNAWNIWFYDFIKSWWKFYPQTFVDKIKAWKFDEELTIKIIELIIKKWFNPNYLDTSWENILFAWLQLGNLNILKLLIENNEIDINLKNKDSKNILLKSIDDKKDLETIKIILSSKKLDFNSTSISWDNLLHLSQTLDINTLNEFLKKNIELNEINQINETPINKIIKLEADEKVIIEKYKLLKEYKKIDLTIKDNEWKNPIIYAVQKWYLDLYKEFKKENIEMKDIKTASWTNLLHFSVQSWKMDLIKEIQKLKIDINSIDDFWNTPLLYAASLSGNLDTISYLLEQKADINKLNNDKNNLLTTSINIKDYKLFDLVLKNLWDFNKIINEETKENIFLKIIKSKDNYLIKKTIQNNKKIKLNPNYIDNEWVWAIEIAINNNDIDTLYYLLNIEKIDLNIKNKLSQTPFILASINWDYNLINLFKKFDNINYQDENWKTRLIYACEKWNENIIKFLIQNKADKDIKDKEDKKCIDKIDKTKIWKEIYNLIK